MVSLTSSTTYDPMTIKRALLVGIDAYDNVSNLGGCVNDVAALLPLVSSNEDDSPNFHCQTRTSSSQRIERRTLLEAVDSLLAPGADVALFYFAGHGAGASNDVVLYTQEGKKGDQGLALS